MPHLYTGSTSGGSFFMGCTSGAPYATRDPLLVAHFPWDALLVPHLYMTGSTSGGLSSMGCTSGAHIYVTGSTSGGSFSIGCTPGARCTVFLLANQRCPLVVWPSFSDPHTHLGLSVDLFVGRCSLLLSMVRWLACSLVSHNLIHFRGDIWSPFMGFTAGGPVLMGSTYRGPIFMGSAYRGPILMGSTYRGPIFLGFAYRRPIFMGSTSILCCGSDFKGSTSILWPLWPFLHGFHISPSYLHGFCISRTYLYGFHILWPNAAWVSPLVTLRYDFILWDHDLVICFYDILTSHSLYIIHLYI